MTDERFKCRFCARTFAKWRAGKDGKPVSGWGALAAHVKDAHEGEIESTLEGIKGQLRSDDDGEGLFE